MADTYLIAQAGLTIDGDVYRTHERYRELADRIMASVNLHTDQVVEIRITEGHTEVDHITHRDPLTCAPTIATIVIDRNGTR